MKFSNSVTIDRPVHDVYAFVTDLENVPTWNHAIAEARQTSDGPRRVGTSYRQLRTIPSRSEETVEVTALEPDRRFAVHGEFGPFVGTLTYEFEEIDGETRLTNEAHLEARGILKVAAPLAAARVREAVATNLGVLKEILERR